MHTAHTMRDSEGSEKPAKLPRQSKVLTAVFDISHQKQHLANMPTCSSQLGEATTIVITPAYLL